MCMQIQSKHAPWAMTGSAFMCLAGVGLIAAGALTTHSPLNYFLGGVFMVTGVAVAGLLYKQGHFATIKVSIAKIRTRHQNYSDLENLRPFMR